MYHESLFKNGIEEGHPTSFRPASIRINGKNERNQKSALQRHFHIVQEYNIVLHFHVQLYLFMAPFFWHPLLVM